MSSLFDVPAQLALILTLAASGPGESTRAAPPVEAAAIAPAPSLLDPEPLEGPYRFSEASWLRALRDNLPADDKQPGLTSRIFRTSGGRYYVPDAAERRSILAARTNADLAARVAQALASDNAARLHAALHRAPTPGDLYIAHVFGLEAATLFIRQTEVEPNDAAASLAPELANSAPEAEAGTPPLTLAQLYNRLTEPMQRFARTPSAQAALKARAQEQAALDLKPTLGEGSHPAVEGALAWRAEVSASAPPLVRQ